MTAGRKPNTPPALADEQIEHVRAVARVYRDMVSDRGDPSGNAILIDVATGNGHHRLYLDELEAVLAEVDALRTENEALRAMLNGLVDNEYNILDLNAEEEWWTCNFCGNIVRRRSRPLGYNSTIELLPHDPLCPWQQARQALGEK